MYRNQTEVLNGLVIKGLDVIGSRGVERDDPKIKGAIEQKEATDETRRA